MRPIPVDSEGERGSALLLVMIMTVTLLGTMSLMISATVSQSQTTVAQTHLREALYAADNGMARAKALIIADLRGTNTFDGASSVALWGVTPKDDAVAEVTDLGDENGGSIFSIKVRATVGGRSRMILSVMSFSPSEVPLVINSTSAGLVALGNVLLKDPLKISGNDYSEAGVLLRPDPTWYLEWKYNPNSGMAIWTTGAVTDGSGSAAALGGNGYRFSSSWSDVTEAVSFTAVDIFQNHTMGTPAAADVLWQAGDPENGGLFFYANNGVDDNNSGTADDSVGELPQNAGQLFGMANNDQLRAAAKADGTLFAVGEIDPKSGGVISDPAGDCDAWCDWGSADASGKVVYLEIDNSSGGVDMGQEIDLPRTAGPEGCVFIVAGTSANNHDVVNFGDKFHVKRQFRGVVVIDGGLIKLSTEIVGQVFSFGNVEIEDSGIIKYSKEMLAQPPDLSILPGVPTGSDYEVKTLTWNELPAPIGDPGTGSW
jgi:hypothetical protein